MERIRHVELHPLQNPTILEEILKNLKLKDLKSCRLVCKVWCQSSPPVMKQSGLEVRILDKSGRRMSDFLELIRVEANDFEPPSFMEHFVLSSLDGDSRAFWEACGRNIKTLYLFFVSFGAVENFRFAIFQSSPNLESLTLFFVKVNGDVPVEPGVWLPPAFPPNYNLKSLQIHSGHEFHPCSWMEILSQFPSLEKFYGFGLDHWPGFFDSLAVARRHNAEWWKLKALGFRLDELPNPLAVFPVLEERGLPLETLKVNGIDRSEDVGALRRILTVHAPTVKELSLNGGSQDSPVMSVFPLQNNAMLENVERLCLGCAIVHSPSFLRSFPNLKKLELTHVRATSEFPDGPVGEWVHSTCSELEIKVEYFTTENFRQLIGKLPNVIKLKVFAFNNDQFRTVCELLPNLEHLEIRWGQMDDMGISGLDEEDVARINAEREEGDWWPITVARANLSSWTKLKWFSWMIPQHRVRNLGYTSALCFQKLHQLQHLRIEGSSSGPILDPLRTQFAWRSSE